MRNTKTSKHLLKVAAFAIAGLFMQASASAQDEPPGRVARVSYSYGNLSFADAGTTEWSTLVPNRPISTGDGLLVPSAGRAELHVGSSALRLQENTSIHFLNLTDDATQIDLQQGSMVVRVRALANNEIFEVNTPNLLFAIQEPGEYRINVNPDNSTTVLVRRGTGVVQGERDTITVREGEQSRFSGRNLQHTQITNALPYDTFDQWAYDRDRAEESAISARYVSREIIGYEQLDSYGAWETTTEYGAVWYPRQVDVTWAPYRDGKWVWVAPWGWTWVDRAPWGFAPYHYGRWAYVGARWAWVPGAYQQHQRPVYAPALVAFVGNGNPGFGNSLNPGQNHPASVGWFPLGPGEIYRPGYARNVTYIQRLNPNVVINNTTIINNRTVFVNQGRQNAVTVVPTNTFVRGDNVMSVRNTKFNPASVQVQAVTHAPDLTPGNGNRFGDARPHGWQDANQFQRHISRNPPAGNEQGAAVNNFNAGPNVPKTELRPQIRSGEVANNPGNIGNNAGNGYRPNNNGNDNVIHLNNLNNRPQVITGPAVPAANNAVTVNPPANANNVNNPIGNPMTGNLNQRSGENQDRGSRLNMRPGDRPGERPGDLRSPNGQPATTPGAPAVVMPAANNGVAPPAAVQQNQPQNMPQRSPNVVNPANNAIMNAPRPAENIDRNVDRSGDRSRYSGNRTPDNAGQQDPRNERPRERSPVQMQREMPQVQQQPQIQQQPQVQQAPRVEVRQAQVQPQQPQPQQVPQPAPRMEMRPAPAAMPAPAPAAPPAPVHRPDKEKEKEDGRKPHSAPER